MGVHNLVWEPTIPNGSPAAVPHGKTFQTLTSIAANYARCGKLGIQIHITQMDVALACDRNGGGKDPCRFCTPRGEIYGQNCQNCLQTPSCTRIQTRAKLTNKPGWVGLRIRPQLRDCSSTGRATRSLLTKGFEEVSNRRPSQQN